VYGELVPKLWNATIDEHRRTVHTVHTAILDTTAALVAEHGLAGVTMSQIAQHAGIGRATLYKYFPDVEAIVVAWHERQVSEHLHLLGEAATGVTDPGDRLRLVLRTYAQLSGGKHHHRPDLAVRLHRAAHMHHARQQLHTLVTQVIRTAAETGNVRTDVPAPELATYCLHALSAAGTMRSNAARDRLVTVTLAGLQTTATA
jgi:AcrR family transcriptional regulator